MNQPKRRNIGRQDLQSRSNLTGAAATAELTETLSFTGATNFIADRVRPRGEKKGDVIDKVRKVLRYAIEKGKLEAAADLSIPSAKLKAWIKTKKQWLGKFDDIPSDQEGGINLTLPSIALVASGTTVPSTLEECHAMIIKLTTDNFKLAQENHVLKGRLDALEPAREAYEKRRTDGSVNGKKGGRGNEI